MERPRPPDVWSQRSEQVLHVLDDEVIDGPENLPRPDRWGETLRLTPRSQARVDWLGLQRQYRKHRLMNAPERLAAGETLQGF
jgi:hypothetical protein